MIYNICEELTYLKDKKKRIDSIVGSIKIKTEEYEKSIEELRQQLVVNRNELDLIKNSFVQVRLGDLIDEISWLSGVNRSNISVSLSVSRIFPSLEDLISFVNDINDNYLIDNVKFSINSNLSKKDIDGVPFSYFSFLSFYYNDVQYDGKTVKDHCYISHEILTNGDVSLVIDIIKEIDDVICKIPFYDLEYKDNNSWYPADLFTQAVINVSSREYNSKVDKIRKKSTFK